MGIEYNVQLDAGCPADDIVHPLLTSLPHFATYDTDLAQHHYGADSRSPDCSVSLETSGFVVCDHLSDRAVARDVLDTLVQNLESLGLGKPVVSEL